MNIITKLFEDFLNLVKKPITIGALAFGLVTSSQALVVTGTVLPGLWTNVLTGPVNVSQIVLIAPVATNASGIFVDSATSNLTYVTLAYTNVISYLTNSMTMTNSYVAGQWNPFYTNYWGVPTFLTNSVGTNYVLVDCANIVPSQTNSYPALALGVAASSTTVIQNINQNFYRGIWVTNSSSSPGPLTYTVTYTAR